MYDVLLDAFRGILSQPHLCRPAKHKCTAASAPPHSLDTTPLNTWATQSTSLHPCCSFPYLPPSISPGYEDRHGVVQY